MKPHAAQALTRCCILAGVVALLPSSSASAMLPPPNKRLGACTAEMARAEELFPEAGGLRVVVTRFVGQGKPSENMGAELAYTLSQDLPEYIRQTVRNNAHAAGLAGDDLRVQYVPCLISTHAQARKVGHAWGADLLFWGQASNSRDERLGWKLPPTVEKGAHVTVDVKGDVQAAKGNVRIGIIDDRRVTIVAEPSRGSFKTSVTLVHWRGLQGRSDEAVHVDPAAVMDLDFPGLASARPLAMFKFAVGVYAFSKKRYTFAAAQFEEAAGQLDTGVEDRSTLYQVMGVSYLLHDGKHQRGLELLEQARASCAGSDAQCQASTLESLGWAFTRLGDRAKALGCLEQALHLRRQVGDRAYEASTLNHVGVAHSLLGDRAKALSYLEQALHLRRQLEDPTKEADTLSSIGSLFLQIRDWANALSYFEQVLILRKRGGARASEAVALNCIGGVYLFLGDQAKALSYFEQALTLQKPEGDRSGEATTIYNIGTVYLNIEDTAKALSYFEQALLLQRQEEDRGGEAATLNSIGAVYFALGHWTKALSNLESALLLRRQAGEQLGEAHTLDGIGAVYFALGDNTKALSYLEPARLLRRQLGEQFGEAITLERIGRVYFALEDKIKALGYFEQALTLKRKLADRSGEARVLNSIGGVYYAIGDNVKALSYLEQALSLEKQEGECGGDGTAWGNLAKLLAKLGRPLQSIAQYREACRCSLERRPPEEVKAGERLEQAFMVALRSKLWSQATGLLSEIQALKPPEPVLAGLQARLAGYSGAPDAAACYQAVSRLAATLRDDIQAEFRIHAKAGEFRARQRGYFADCPGVVVMKVDPDSPAARLGLQTGDILLRYQDQCVDESAIEAMQKSPPSKSASLRYVRQDFPQTLTIQGGRLGITVEEF